VKQILQAVKEAVLHSTAAANASGSKCCVALQQRSAANASGSNCCTYDAQHCCSKAAALDSKRLSR